ncbi:peptidylprolyl isomerase [Paenibacillus sp. sptzw28]|uniref:peptidylprolyl isomerase n=1 Tax=Paenibacillus sp. sptzw28 TaxID=715179 RepID=UPI001C6F0F8C|nr:peptidylprolyl isomerase [Paenibacillus sp. sptzw28]QYR22872.1 peptidylprolyl isomerase [Paenibacillus sp. sptzw28]
MERKDIGGYAHQAGIGQAVKGTALKGLLLVSIISLLVVLSGCGAKGTPNTPKPADSGKTSGATASTKNPDVTIEMEDGKTIEIELYPEIAPNTVNNFISLVKKGFYEGLIFHRVIPGFMIQGGDPDGTGAGGPGYSIKGEFTSNGFQNFLLHQRGVISMARSSDLNSAGSQFFIMVADAPSLDGEYAAFGKVIKGMDTVDAIVSVPRGAQDRPTNPPKMKKVTVDTKGIDYPEPEKITP